MKSNRRGGLGRGLGALIPTAAPVESAAGGTATALATPPATTDAPDSPSAPTNGVSAQPREQLAPVPGARFAEIPVTSIMPNPKQPRQVFDDDAIEELKTSIREVGFLQPIVVRELPEPIEPDGPDAATGEAGVTKKYELVMGERRWRAAQALGKDMIPAIVRETRDDAMLRDALLENIHRANLNPLEEAAAYQQLLEEFGATHEELARRIGRSRPQISNTIRLLNLPAQVQRRVAAGILSAGHARALLGLDSSEEQETLAHRIVAEGLSVRATEEMVSLAVSEGGAAKKAAPQRRAKPHAPALSDLADRLSDRFDTRVKVDIGQRKGRITIEFATVDDLERIVGIIGVDERGQREQ